MPQQPALPRVLIAADVFGVTPELGRFAGAIGAAATLASPHPFNRSFRSEAEGYASFMASGGVVPYAEHLAGILAGRPFHFDLAIGFSAGASALWLCLADARLEPRLPRRAVLYYGSRIRDHADLEPRRHARLVFAEREASFDPCALAAALRQRGGRAVVLPGTAHGFMNPRSAGYDEELATAEAEGIRALLGFAGARPRRAFGIPQKT
ncbi:MAG: hydrolase [Desulfovibrio sp.]|jgi:dienelactone hydrolase|nr:hydrolase [Desulfovibrio sp.]